MKKQRYYVALINMDRSWERPQAHKNCLIFPKEDFNVTMIMPLTEFRNQKRRVPKEEQ